MASLLFHIGNTRNAGQHNQVASQSHQLKLSADSSSTNHVTTSASLSGNLMQLADVAMSSRATSMMDRETLLYDKAMAANNPAATSNDLSQTSQPQMSLSYRNLVDACYRHDERSFILYDDQFEIDTFNQLRWDNYPHHNPPQPGIVSSQCGNNRNDDALLLVSRTDPEQFTSLLNEVSSVNECYYVSVTID